MKPNPYRNQDELREAFLAKVATLWPVAKGSLTLTRSPCIRKNCKECASGRKHPKLLFTYREEGKLKGLNVRPPQEKLVRQAIENGRELERLMTAGGHELILSLREEQKK